MSCLPCAAVYQCPPSHGLLFAPGALDCCRDQSTTLDQTLWLLRHWDSIGELQLGVT